MGTPALAVSQRIEHGAEVLVLEFHRGFATSFERATQRLIVLGLVKSNARCPGAQHLEVIEYRAS